jgi:hypothetical protein
MSRNQTVISLLLVVFLQACAPQAPTPSTPTATTGPITADSIMATCPSADEVAAIDARVDLHFELNPYPSKLVCLASEGSADLTLFERNVYNALRVMQALEFDEPLPWTDLSLYDWFTQAASGAIFSAGYQVSHCCSPEGLTYIQKNSFFSEDTDQWIADGMQGGVRDLMVLLIHEARHSDTGIGHPCEPVNIHDNNLEEMQAWAVQHYTLLWMADHAAEGFFTEGERDLSRAEAQWVHDYMFCDYQQDSEP